MKITAAQEQLSHGLRIAGRAVASRSPLPITTNVLLATEDSRLKIAATNLEIAISTWIDASVAEDGAITLPAKLLSEFVDTLPGGPVDVHVKRGGYTAHLHSGRYEANRRRATRANAQKTTVSTARCTSGQPIPGEAPLNALLSA